jgi:glycosyltransferase involved in cell wall biosynthesis
VRIALIAPPFIQVPPKRYGGTELFLGNLAKALQKQGHEVVVYSNGESEVPVETRWLYPRDKWPIKGEFSETLMEINQAAWAIEDAADSCDIIHINNVFGLPHSRFLNIPFVYTIHHDHDPATSEFYSHYADVHYVTISDFQREREIMPNLRTIHHGIDLSCYRYQEKKQPYMSFLGRIAPMKGAHVAIEIAQRTGIPLKMAGEIQPVFRGYYETEIKPHIDGKLIEYLGEADLALKNELLGNSIAFLFPIQWNEPFGLVMIEAMACGTPVLALAEGSVPEIICNGVNGYACDSVDEMVTRARNAESWICPATVRHYAEQNFSMERMAAEYAALYTQAGEPVALNSELDFGMNNQEPAAA